MILYALIAVPLMAMFLTKVGNEFADLIERIYHRGCCFFCWKRREISHGRDPNAPEDLENLASLENRSKSAWGNSENESLFKLNSWPGPYVGSMMIHEGP